MWQYPAKTERAPPALSRDPDPRLQPPVPSLRHIGGGVQHPGDHRGGRRAEPALRHEQDGLGPRAHYAGPECGGVGLHALHPVLLVEEERRAVLHPARKTLLRYAHASSS